MHRFLVPIVVRECAARVGAVPALVRGQHLALRSPCNRSSARLSTLPDDPFQQGTSLNAANFNYDTLKAMQAMKRLNQLESIVPRN